MTGCLAWVAASRFAGLGMSASWSHTPRTDLKRAGDLTAVDSAAGTAGVDTSRGPFACAVALTSHHNGAVGHLQQVLQGQAARLVP